MKNYYSDQYQHPNWQKKRLEVLTIADFKCELCHDTETQLHVHHRFYRKAKIWEYENYEFAVLCEDCHSLIHGKVPDLFWRVLHLGLVHASLLDFEGAVDFQKHHHSLLLRFNMFGTHEWFDVNKYPEGGDVSDPDLVLVLNSKSHRSTGPHRFQYNPIVRAFVSHGQLIGLRDFITEQERDSTEAIIESFITRMIPVIFPYYCPKWDQAGKVQYDNLKPLRDIYPRGMHK